MTPAEARKAASQASISSDLQEKINDKFEQIKKADFYGILEVPNDADFGRVQKAYLTLAKVYHPDRVAQAGDEEIQHRMEVIFSKVNEAYQTLTDSKARVKYDRESEKAAATKEPGKGMGPRPEEAKIQYQKAMVYMKKRDLVKACEAMRWACDMDPENGDYKAYRVYLDYERSEEPEEKKLEEAKADMAAVYKTYLESFWAARLFATLLQKSGDMDNYGRALTRANKLNPRDHTTTRDLRLFRAREEKKSKEGRFLGIKFKK